MPILFKFKAIIPILLLLTITEYCIVKHKSMKRGKMRKYMSGTIFQIHEKIIIIISKVYCSSLAFTTVLSLLKFF